MGSHLINIEKITEYCNFFYTASNACFTVSNARKGRHLMNTKEHKENATPFNLLAISCHLHRTSKIHG